MARPRLGLARPSPVTSCCWRPGALRPREPPLGRLRRQGRAGTNDGQPCLPRQLARSATSLANSEDHAWTCGSLMPNDLGLFDMLGNAVEWVQDRDGRPDQIIDDIDISENV